MTPLFSVITPCFNAATKLEASFASVMRQDQGLFEYLIVDGASTDHTLKWLNSRNEPNFCWISQNDTGVYDAMNKGITCSKGRFLIFLGAGDTLLPDSLQQMAYYIQQNPSPIPRFIYGDVRDLHTGRPFTAGPYSKLRISRENICHQGIFYERGIFDLLGPYELRYPIMSDWAFNLRCFGDARVRKLHFPKYVADFEGGGLCSHTGDNAFAQDRCQLITERIGPGHAFYYRLETALKWRLRRILNFKF